MKKWVTEFKAIEAATGQMKTWIGQNVEAPTMQLAQEWCNNNAGHLKVVGELVAEIPCHKGTYNPDFANMVDYEIINNN